MTKVPFDWDTFLNNKVIVKLDSRKMAEEFLSYFELIPSEKYTKSMLLDLAETHDGFRFNNRVLEGHGTFRIYLSSELWNDYLMMEYDYSSLDGISVEVGDLL